MSPKGGKKKKPKKKGINIEDRAHTRSRGPPPHSPPPNTPANANVTTDASPTIEGNINNNGQPNAATLVQHKPPVQVEDHTQRMVLGANDTVDIGDNGIASDEEAVEETKENVADDEGEMEETSPAVDVGTSDKTAVEGTGDAEEEVPPLAPRDDSSSDDSASVGSTEEVPPLTQHDDSSSESPASDGSNKEVVNAGQEWNSDDESKASTHLQLFDDVSINTNNLVTPVRHLHGDVQQQTNSFDQVLAILLEMKETNSMKADLLATRQEIKDELRSEMAEATETVRQLGVENRNWMQQQNEKINKKLAEALVESLVNQKMEGLKPMVQESIAEVAAAAIGDAKCKLEHFNSKTLEHEEELKSNNKECREALDKIKHYEERYGNIAKEASDYKALKGKIENLERHLATMQETIKNVEALGQRGQEVPFQDADGLESLKNYIVKNRDHMDTTMKEFELKAKEMVETNKAFDKRVKKMEELRTRIDENSTNLTSY